MRHVQVVVCHRPGQSGEQIPIWIKLWRLNNRRPFARCIQGEKHHAQGNGQ